VAEEAVCWLCGSGYRASVTECGDCRLPLLPADGRVGPTPSQRRVRELADGHLGRRERDRVRLALAALPDLLTEDESVVWLTDSTRARRRGVLVITTQALCWVPVDEEAQVTSIELGAIQQVGSWPGDGGQLRITTDDDLHVFTDVGGAVWLGQFSEVLRATIGAPEGGQALAGHYNRPGG
jgi:hypothetical protein